jgi:hypothetical protein
MDGQRTKRRGPLLWLAGISWRFSIVVAFLPVLYVASLGPLVWVVSRVPVNDMPLPIQSAFLLYASPFHLAVNSDACPDWLRGGIFWYLKRWA